MFSAASLFKSGRTVCLVCILIVFNVKAIIIATTFASKNYFFFL